VSSAHDHDRRDDPALLAAIAVGDVSALEALLARYWSPLTMFVMRLTGSREAAEDAVQDAFCRLWERRRAWRGDGLVSGLLLRLARNSAVSTHRHLSAQDRADATAAEARPRYQDPDLPNDDRHEALERAIAALPPRRREVFLLRVVHDLSYKDIATVMGTSTQTVANQLSHALAFLRERLSGDGAATD
jgi:RNA polymerase sigma factor (sigma-70 family)